MLDYIPIELINILGLAICIIALIYGITHQEPPFKERLNHDRAEAQKAEAYKKKQRYNRRYNYWYNKSYDCIKGCAAQTASKRHLYARKKALKDLNE